VNRDNPEETRKGVLATEVASTPSPFAGVATDQVLGQLEFTAARLLDAGDPFRPEVVPDVNHVVDALRVSGNVLEPEELNAVRSAIEGRSNRGDSSN
jgi:hypothetical protein